LISFRKNDWCHVPRLLFDRKKTEYLKICICLFICSVFSSLLNCLWKKDEVHTFWENTYRLAEDVHQCDAFRKWHPNVPYDRVYCCCTWRENTACCYVTWSNLEPAQNSSSFKMVVDNVMACLNGKRCVCLLVRFCKLWRNYTGQFVYLCIHFYFTAKQRFFFGRSLVNNFLHIIRFS
jgi:hypothetical protein